MIKINGTKWLKEREIRYKLITEEYQRKMEDVFEYRIGWPTYDNNMMSHEQRDFMRRLAQYNGEFLSYPGQGNYMGSVANLFSDIRKDYFPIEKLFDHYLKMEDTFPEVFGPQIRERKLKKILDV